MVSIVKINYPEIKLLEKFLEEAGDSLRTFRYFEKRPLSAIKDHFVTLLCLIDDKPVGYGHLDSDEATVWLGLAIIPKFKGRGLGKMLVDKLLSDARILGLQNIQLSVDNANAAAINLYKRFGFETFKVDDTRIFMKLSL